MFSTTPELGELIVVQVESGFVFAAALQAPQRESRSG